MKPYHKNPRKITKKKYDRLEDTLSRLGDLSGIVHNLITDEIIGGNQRMQVFTEGTPEIIEQRTEPDEQGTMGHGFIIWRGYKFAYRQVAWDEPTSEEANIAANIGAGSWDFEVFANMWDTEKLPEYGMGADLLEVWQDNTLAMIELLEAGVDVENDKLLEKEQQIRPREMFRILISVPLDYALDAKELTEQICKIEDCEIIYGAN